MVERLALGIIPGVGWRASEIRSVAQEAEAAGFDAIFSAEVNNDVLATAQLMGEATKTIKVGSWIANIYLRQSYTMRKGSRPDRRRNGGRMILGLGVSHQPINRALGIDMPSPIDALRQYTIKVASWLRGEGPATHLPQQPASHPCRSISARLPRRRSSSPASLRTASCPSFGRPSASRAARPGSRAAVPRPQNARSWR